MVNRLKNWVKYNKTLYSLYFAGGSFLLKILGLFLKTDDNMILYVVYGGQRYDDSPRFVYEYLRSNEKYQRYKHIWAFVDPEKMKIEKIPVDNMVRIDTIKYYIIALKAKYWVTNSSASRGLNFKKDNTVNIMFQHGTAGIKKLDADINEGNKSFSIKSKERFDYIFIQGKKEEEILKRAWSINGDNLYNIGLPRNDELAHYTQDKVEEIKRKLGIPKGKKVLLYAPTFREYNLDSRMNPYLKPPISFGKWKRELQDNYVLLITAHYEVAKLLDVPDQDGFVINAFKYPYINDLMIVSDYLISDYSSIIFDYSILGRPVLSFAYDYDSYVNERGVYPGYEELFSKGIIRTEEELIDAIKTIEEGNYDNECEYTKKQIRDKYISSYGEATEKAVELIFG